MAPTVDAGADASIQLPVDSVMLDATVSDDGLPDGSTVTMAWSVQSGPAGATFDDATAEDPTVTFVSAGTYVLELTASDSELEASDTVQVIVEAAAGNNVPVVTINSPADNSSFVAGATVSFQASATDDEDDDATLTGAIEWSSDIDGALGTGGTLDVSTLSVNTHVVTASVTDSGAATGSESVNVTITAPVAASALWTFDEGAGTVAADSLGDYDATITGAEHVAGASATALDFSGVDDRVVVDDASALDISGTEISLVAWINPRIGGKNEGSRVISKRAGLGAPEVFAMTVDDWTHVAMVYDGTDMRIYVNGGLDATTPVAKADPIDSSAFAVHIGLQEKAAYNGTNEQDDFEGLIDEVRILDRALSAVEVTALYDELAASLPPRTGLAFADVSALLENRLNDSGSQGVAFAEVDADNNVDYFLALAAPGDVLRDVYYKNFNSANRFRDLTNVAGLRDENDDDGSYGGIWADLDNDGDYDLVNASTFADGSFGAPGNPAPNNVYENDGTGVFTDVTDADITATAIESQGVVAFDMDADGDLDLFSISNESNPGVKEAYRNDLGFAFTPHVGGDLTSASLPTTQGVTDTDYDGDGDVDILAGNRGGVAGFDGEFAILENDGLGNFTRVLPLQDLGIDEPAHTGITTADIDNDGDLDLLLNSSNRGDLWRNNGGSYSKVRRFNQTAGNTGVFADLDNDGDLDLVFAGDERVYLNNGAGGFSNGQSVPVGGIVNPRSLAFADIDNDGDMDFAITAQDSLSWLVRNLYNGGNNWIKLELIAANGQAGAFGAKTFVYRTGTTEQLGMRESRSNQGYLSQDNPVLHFGLGLETSVDVVVQYVDGSQTTCTGVAANARYLIDETAADPCNPNP
jgi:hypothetical protein